jgi:dihydrofolate reductase
LSINIIAAIGLGSELGYKNKLLCDLPNDLRHFKELTQGNICVMGRKTYQSLGKPLTNRINVILSHKKNFNIHHGVYVYHSVQDVLREYENYSNKEAELFICGGEEIYKQFIPYADKMYITVIDYVFDKADTFFPSFNLSDWKVVESIANKADENHAYDFHFVKYERRN